MATDWATLERGVIHRALKDRAVMAAAAGALASYTCTERETQWVWDFIIKTWEDTAEAPNVSILRANIEMLPEVKQEPLVKELIDILRTPQDIRPRATMDTLVKRARAMAALGAMESAGALFDKGSHDEGVEALERGLVSRTARVGIKPKPLVPKVFKPIIHQPRIPTGLWRLDKWIGGLQRTELGLIVGATGVGKSALTTTIGVTGVLHKLKVVVIDTENGEHVVRSRYMSNMAGVPQRNIESNSMSRVEKEQLDSWLNRNSSRLSDHLQVIYLNYMENTLSDVESALRSLIDSGWVPDLVIFDSPDHLLLKGASDVRWELFAELYNTLKRLAQRLNVGLWCVTQAGAEFEDKIATNRAAADSYQKPRTASIMISINTVPKRGKDSRKVRTDEDMLEGGERCVFVGKNRNGPARFLIPIATDWKHMKMKAPPDLLLGGGTLGIGSEDDDEDDDAA